MLVVSGVHENAIRPRLTRRMSEPDSPANTFAAASPSPFSHSSSAEGGRTMGEGYKSRVKVKRASEKKVGGPKSPKNGSTFHFLLHNRGHFFRLVQKKTLNLVLSKAIK